MFPPDLVDEVIAGAGRSEVRSRSLPARVMAYFAIGMALYAEGSYGDVLAQLTDGLSWASGWQEEYALPSKSAIFQARARLGAEPLQRLFQRVARPLGVALILAAVCFFVLKWIAVRIARRVAEATERAISASLQHGMSRAGLRIP